MKLNIGDQVKVISDVIFKDEIEVGDIGVVQVVHDDLVVLDFVGTIQIVMYDIPEYIELLDESHLKVGDKVRIITDSHFHDDVKIGDIMTVVEISGETVTISNGELMQVFGQSYYTDVVELVDESETFEMYDVVKLKSAEEILEIEQCHNIDDVSYPGLNEYMLFHFEGYSEVVEIDNSDNTIKLSDGYWYKPEWLDKCPQYALDIRPGTMITLKQSVKDMENFPEINFGGRVPVDLVDVRDDTFLSEGVWHSIDWVDTIEIKSLHDLEFGDTILLKQLSDVLEIEGLESIYDSAFDYVSIEEDMVDKFGQQLGVVRVDNDDDTILCEDLKWYKMSWVNTTGESSEIIEVGDTFLHHDKEVILLGVDNEQLRVWSKELQSIISLSFDSSGIEVL